MQPQRKVLKTQREHFCSFFCRIMQELSEKVGIKRVIRKKLAMQMILVSTKSNYLYKNDTKLILKLVSVNIF